MPLQTDIWSLGGFTNELIPRIRIPDIQKLFLKPCERAKYASEKLNGFTQNKIDVLVKLAKRGCSAPRLISWKREKQDKAICVPGGCFVYILMEKLPVVYPLNFCRETLHVERPRQDSKSIS